MGDGRCTYRCSGWYISLLPSPDYFGAIARDYRELSKSAVIEQLPPLLAHGRRVAEVVLVHRLDEGGVVGSEDEFAHGLESIRYLISQYVIATSSLSYEPERFESTSARRGTHR